jgi:hypothetical protein
MLEAKKTYETPRLVDRGSVSALTLGPGVHTVEASVPPWMLD